MSQAHVPLAERLRPKKLDAVVGQDHLLGEEGILTQTIRSGKPQSIILWGPPGCGNEIHRFNKAQQEAFLPFIEDGTLVLVGATAENPSFHLSHALLSRCQVLTLDPLNETALEILLNRYEEAHKALPLTPPTRKLLLTLAQGDGRYLINMIEL